MTLRWYGGEPYEPPAQVECPKVGYPNADVRGRPQFVNTHFDDEREAWENVRGNVEAGVHLDRRAGGSRSRQSQGPTGQEHRGIGDLRSGVSRALRGPGCTHPRRTQGVGDGDQHQ